MSNAQYLIILRAHNDVSNYIHRVILYKNGATYEIYCSLYDDSGVAHNGSHYTIADAPHYIGLKFIQATGPASANGSLELFVDGVSQGSVTGVQSYTQSANIAAVRMGVLDNPQSGTTGKLFFDELEFNDTGDAIGA
jgi:hypothetical protein